MQLGFFISGTAGQVAQNKMDTISHSLANANTVGYMEDRSSFSSMFSNEQARQGQPDQTSSAYLTMNSQYVSTKAGTIRQTGGDLDFSIQGNGYFRVRLEDGGEAMTRAGNFKLDANGNLLTQGDLPLLNQDGDPIQLSAGKISITQNGALYVNGEPVATLGLSSINDPRQIEKLGGVLIRTPKSNISAAGPEVSVHQGTLMDSNVNSIQLMAEMVDTMRNYQSMMKIVEQFNQQAGLLNDRVGMVQG